MKPLMIIVSFDVGEQVVPGGIPSFVASLVHEFGFQIAESLPSGRCPGNFPSRAYKIVGSSRCDMPSFSL
jgi:hypothetical protein